MIELEYFQSDISLDIVSSCLISHLQTCVTFVLVFGEYLKFLFLLLSNV